MFVGNPVLLKILAAAVVLLLVAVLYRLTLYEEDPCANPRGDIGAAVLADESGDQDALVNRAIIIKANCPEEEKETQ